MSQTLNPLVSGMPAPGAPLARNPLLPQQGPPNPLIDMPGIQAMTPPRPAPVSAADAIARRWAGQYGISPQAAAATLAALSPQKDLSQNVDLGRRLLDIRRGQANSTMSPEMMRHGEDHIAAIRDETTRNRVRQTIESFRAKPFGQITDPYEQAIWARFHDEAHNPRHYPVISPDGQPGNVAVTDRGAPQRAAWGSFREIARAMAALNSARR